MQFQNELTNILISKYETALKYFHSGYYEENYSHGCLYCLFIIK